MTEAAEVPKWKLRPELLVLVALAALTRFWGLFHPGVVVFDERTFEQYAGAYFTGSFYFDVHPPLGKLLVAATARLLGVPGSVLQAAQPAVAVRLLPATAGALIVPLVWLMLRQLGAGRTVAALAAWMVLLDNGLLVQSRFILLDTMLMALGLAAVTLFLARRGRSGGTRWLLFAASGLCAGLSASVKWTGLAALGLILAALGVELVRGSRDARARRAAEGIFILVIAVAAYVSTFAVHFALLHRGGPFLTQLLDVHREMVHSEGLLGTATHEYSSRWYQWPFLVRPIHLWRSEPLPGGRIENIHLLGNPVVWLGALVGVVITIAGVMRRTESFASQRRAIAFLAGGLAISYVPLMMISRVMFIYSYFPTLLFEIALACVGMGVLAGWTREPERLFVFPTPGSRRLFWGLAAAALVSFGIVAPISYGWPVKIGGVYEYTPYRVSPSSNGSPVGR